MIDVLEDREIKIARANWLASIAKKNNARVVMLSIDDEEKTATKQPKEKKQKPTYEILEPKARLSRAKSRLERWEILTNILRALSIEQAVTCETLSAAVMRLRGPGLWTKCSVEHDLRVMHEHKVVSRIKIKNRRGKFVWGYLVD